AGEQGARQAGTRVYWKYMRIPSTGRRRYPVKQLINDVVFSCVAQSAPHHGPDSAPQESSDGN
ncbi:MAG: hypothetical protein ACLPXB_16705, partial [Thiobacillaceae bacterium]